MISSSLRTRAPPLSRPHMLLEVTGMPPPQASLGPMLGLAGMVLVMTGVQLQQPALHLLLLLLLVESGVLRLLLQRSLNGRSCRLTTITKNVAWLIPSGDIKNSKIAGVQASIMFRT
jgi:hypothetical protein